MCWLCFVQLFHLDDVKWVTRNKWFCLFWEGRETHAHLTHKTYHNISLHIQKLQEVLTATILVTAMRGTIWETQISSPNFQGWCYLKAWRFLWWLQAYRLHQCSAQLTIIARITYQHIDINITHTVFQKISSSGNQVFHNDICSVV